MAINKWANITISGGAASQPDRQDHKHTSAPGTADAGSLTVAWDNAVCTRMTLWDSMVAAARQIAASQLPP